MMKNTKNVKFLFLPLVIFLLVNCGTGQKYIIKEVEIKDANKSHLIQADSVIKSYFIRNEDEITFNIYIDETDRVCDTPGKIWIEGDSCKMSFHFTDCDYYTDIFPREINLFRMFWQKTGAYEKTENGFNILYDRNNIIYKFVFIQSFE